MNKQIGAIIKYYRQKQNLSQSQLSDGICVPSYLSKIENGEVSPTNLIVSDLAKKLGIKLSHDVNQVNLTQKAIEYFLNLRVDLLHETIAKCRPNLIHTESALNYLTLMYLDGDKSLASLLLSVITRMPDKEVYDKALMIYSINQDESLLERYYHFAGVGYYYKALLKLKERKYNMAIALVEKGETLFLSEGRLHGLLKCINLKGIIYASMNDFDSAKQNYLRLDKMLTEVNIDSVDFIERVDFNLNYVLYRLNEDNNLENLLETKIKKRKQVDSTMHHTLISIYGEDNIDKTKKIIDDGLSLFEKGSYDYLHIEVEQKKFFKEGYTTSDEYFNDLEMIIEHLSNEPSHVEYNAKISEMVEFLKAKRRYKEAMTYIERLNSFKN